jgi:hypothetical protein
MTTTCTVRTATRGACGGPAVTTFTGRGGETFAECAEHAVTVPTPTPEVATGARVEVRHAGLTKVGHVTRLTPTLAFVEVTTRGGRGRSIVRVPRAGLVVAS